MNPPVDMDLDLPRFVEPPEPPLRFDPEFIEKLDAWRLRDRVSRGELRQIDPEEIPTVPFEWRH
ncbi:MAG: hypothetical protein ACR2OZ_08685 [Verrucomicrobiales bacterium]